MPVKGQARHRPRIELLDPDVVAAGLLGGLALARVPWQIFAQRALTWRRQFVEYLTDYADSRPPLRAG